MKYIRMIRDGNVHQEGSVLLVLTDRQNAPEGVAAVDQRRAAQLLALGLAEDYDPDAPPPKPRKKKPVKKRGAASG